MERGLELLEGASACNPIMVSWKRDASQAAKMWWWLTSEGCFYDTRQQDQEEMEMEAGPAAIS